jgi:molybdopterin molybdotransferase
MSAPGPNPLAAGENNVSVDDALQAMRAVLAPVEGTETVALTQTLQRVLAADVTSPIDVPAHDNSAMDGYAFAGTCLRGDAPVQLRATGTVLAGAPFGGTVGAGECVRIMTGAVMPAGLDTVVPLELCTVEGGLVRIAPGTVRAGEHLRRRGEDLAAGKAALHAGRVMRPADIGLAASLGMTEVAVRRRLRVALFSTGDEVVAPGQPLPPGGIYDSNRFSLAAALQRLGAEVIDLGLVRDDPRALEATLRSAVERADVVVTSGGVSAGDADYTRDVLARMGEVAFWKVAMRPGRPFAFGPLRHAGRQAWLFALPGNPVAALVTYYVFARDGLLRLAGARPEPLPALRARSTAAIRKRPGRTEFQRAVVSRAADGGWQVALTGAQGAGILRSMSEANGMIVLHHAQGDVAVGDEVDVLPFDGLV